MCYFQCCRELKEERMTWAHGGYSPSCLGKHGGRRLRWLATLCPQPGSRERIILVLYTLSLLMQPRTAATEWWYPRLGWVLPSRHPLTDTPRCFSLIPVEWTVFTIMVTEHGLFFFPMMLRIKPRFLFMLRKQSTTELQPKTPNGMLKFILVLIMCKCVPMKRS